jgi:excisionase family DNA binding protein
MENHQSNIQQLEAGVKLYSIHRAATMLGIGRDTLLALVDKGEISTIDVLGRKKISLAELIRYTSRNPESLPFAILPKKNSDGMVTMQREIDQDTINKIFIKSKKEVLSYEEEK